MKYRRRSLPIVVVLVAAMLPSSVLAAISAAMTWEVRTTGSDTACSGGFRGGAFIAAPSAPSVSNAGTGGTVAANTYYCVVTYTDGLGDTVISGQSSTTTSGTTSTITVTSPSASTGALTWNCYFGTTTAGPYFPQGTTLSIGSNRVVTTTPPTTGVQPRGVDYTLQNGAQVAIDNGTITATTTGANSNVLTFTLGYTPTGVLVGNTLRTTGGTNINVGSYEITAVTTTTITVAGAGNLTTAGGAGSAILGVIGGAHASPGQAYVAAVASNSVYVKAGTYVLANGTVNTSGNRISTTSGGVLVGYNTNRYPGNTDTKPVFDAGAASMTVLTLNGNPSPRVSNFSVTNSATRASVTAIGGSGTQGSVDHCSIADCSVPYGAGTTIDYSDMYSHNCGTISMASANATRCVQDTPTATGFGLNSGSACKDCIVIANPNSTNGFTFGVSTGKGVVENCVVYGSVGAASIGFGLTNGTRAIGCIDYGSAGTGFMSSGSSANQLINCAAGGNLVDYDASFASYQKINCVTLTASPFTNAAGGDFSLNTTGGGGALCRGSGIPGIFPGIATTGYRDMGAAQTQSAGGTTGKKAGPGGGKVGMLDRPDVYRFPVPRETRYTINRKAG